MTCAAPGARAGSAGPAGAARRVQRQSVPATPPAPADSVDHRQHRRSPSPPARIDPDPARLARRVRRHPRRAIGRRPQAGIAALPNHVLTPVAKAELYTAKGSPRGRPRRSSQALLAEAPDLPQAEQLARMALTRGATTAPPIVATRRAGLARLGAAPLRAPAPVQGDPAADQLRAALDPLAQGRRRRRGRGAADPGRALSVVRSARRGRRSASPGPIISLRPRRRCAPGRRHLARSARAATGRRSRRGFRASRRGGSDDCEAASRAFREVAAHRDASASLAPAAYYWAARVRAGVPPAALGRAAAARPRRARTKASTA